MTDERAITLDDAIANDENPLTPEQAARAADILAGAESESASLLLLLCFALANEQKWEVREAMLAAISKEIAPLVINHELVLKAAMREQLGTLSEKGGAS